MWMMCYTELNGGSLIGPKQPILEVNPTHKSQGWSFLGSDRVEPISVLNFIYMGHFNFLLFSISITKFNQNKEKRKA